MSKLSVSVIIAAYHGEQFIGEQLRSLFRQTYVPSEILIGDDSSDDLTQKAAELVIPEAPCPVKIIKNIPAKGCVQNFSMLAEAAGSDLVFFCDQDDIWLPEKIEKMVQEFELHPETSVVFCNSRFVDAELNDLGCSTADILRVTPEAVRKINEQNDLSDFIKSPMMYGHNIAIRKNVLRGALPIPARVKSHDLYLNYISSVYVLRSVPDNLTLFRRHGKNLSSQETFWTRIRNILSGKRNSELFDSWNHLDAAVEMLKKQEISGIRRENLLLLEGTRDFFRKRLFYAAGPFLLRIRAILILKQYFQYGFGFKSFIRDILAGAKMTEEQNRIFTFNQ